MMFAAAGAVLVAAIYSHAYHSYLRVEVGRLKDAEASRLHETGTVAALTKRLEQNEKDAAQLKSEVKTFMANVRIRQ